MEPVFYLSLDNYLCLPQTSSGTLNQGAGAWVFVQAGCVCAHVRARGGLPAVLSTLQQQSD